MDERMGSIAVRARLLYTITALACWMLLSVSLGWYYTVTYFGRVGWPMPSLEAVGALLLYYFSVLNVATEIQALHWVLAFPLAGLLWVLLLPLAAWPERPRVPLLRLAAAIALSSLPLSLPLPYMVYAAGFTREGWQWQHVLAVALRRGSLPPWEWLSPMYLAVALVALGLHLWVLRRYFTVPWPRFLRQMGIACVGFVLACCVVGTLISFPLRAALE